MLGTALAASLFMMANAAAAQNTTEPAGGTTPSTGTERPTTSTPAPAPAPAVPAPADTPSPRTEVIVVPQTQTAPPPTALPPIELEDTAYPNGFADPNATYGNDLSVAVQQESDGFDWGLLGLLGLFGLFGLYRRRDGYTRTVHAERYDDGRPPRV
jgi:MYXO-CTERM domain-containing protein